MSIGMSRIYHSASQLTCAFQLTYEMLHHGHRSGNLVEIERERRRGEKVSSEEDTLETRIDN